MSNTNMDRLYPEFWLQTFDKLDQGDFGLHRTLSNNMSPALASYGQSVTVGLQPDLGDANELKPNVAQTATDFDQEAATLTLDRSFYKRIQLTDEDLSMMGDGELIQKYGVALAKSIYKAVGREVHRELRKTKNFIDAASSFTKDTVISAGTALDKNEVDSMGRILMANPDDYGSMLGFSEFSDWSKSNDPRVIQMGVLGEKYGFGIGKSHAIERVTPADLTGAVNLLAGYAAGVSTIAVDAFADSANPIRPGAVIKFANHATKYVVASTNNSFARGYTPAATTSITLATPLTNAVVDDEVITVTADRSAFAYVPAAAAFAARALKPKRTTMQSAIGDLNGIPIRITIGEDTGTLNTFLQYDVLFGVKLVNQNRIVRILR